MKWFRLYAEIKDDPKMLELDDSQFRTWINLLAMASEADERGVIPAHRPRGLAAALHTTVENMEPAFALFAEIGMIEQREDGSILLTNFMDRQYDNPSDRPEKVAERKARLKERHGNEGAKKPERVKNDPGTSEERQKNDTYSDSEDTQKIQDKTPPSEEGAAGADTALPVKKPAKSQPVKERQEALGQEACTAYQTRYKARYEVYAELVQGDSTKLKELRTNLGEEKFYRALDNFFRCENPVAVRRRHAVAMFSGEINVWLNTAAVAESYPPNGLAARASPGGTRHGLSPEARAARNLAALQEGSQ